MCLVCSQPTIETVASSCTTGCVCDIFIPFETLEILSHVGWSPRRVASQGLNERPILFVGIDCDHSVVGRTTSQGGSTGVPDTLECRTCRWVQANICFAGRRCVCGLRVQCFSGVIGVMSGEEIPRHWGEFTGGGE